MLLGFTDVVADAAFLPKGKTITENLFTVAAAAGELI